MTNQQPGWGVYTHGCHAVLNTAHHRHYWPCWQQRHGQGIQGVRLELLMALISMLYSSALLPACTGLLTPRSLAPLWPARPSALSPRSLALLAHIRRLSCQAAMAKGGSAEAAPMAAVAVDGPAPAVDPALLALALRQHPRIILGTGSSSRRGGCSVQLAQR